MTYKTSVFLICPVRNASEETRRRIKQYVAELEARNIFVHWPERDTKQDDPTGGVLICQTNARAIMDYDEIHFWWDETSGGSKFDFGMVFMLVEMLGWEKGIVIVNKDEIVDKSSKSFFQVLQYLARENG